MRKCKVMFTDQVKTEQLLAAKFFQCSMSEKERERERTRERKDPFLIQTSKLLVLNNDLSLYLNLFMGFLFGESCCER